jgi:chromosome segregation ATPase
MEQGQLIVSLVSVIVMFIPIGLILWKIAHIVFKVEKNEKEISTFNTKFNEFVVKRTTIEEKINSIESKGSIPVANLEYRVQKLEDFSHNTEQSITKLEAKVDSIEIKLNELSLDVKQILKQMIIK